MCPSSVILQVDCKKNWDTIVSEKAGGSEIVVRRGASNQRFQRIAEWSNQFADRGENFVNSIVSRVEGQI